VGGHCIGVDPYYLTHKAQEIGYHPEVILAGRRINDGMGAYVAEQVVRLMARAKITLVGARVLVLGLTFKENCPDLRNTRVTDIVNELEQFHVRVDVHDPAIDVKEAVREYGLSIVEAPEAGSYDAIVLAVAHREFVELGPERIKAWGRAGAVLYDVKSVFPRDTVDGRL
jgi:UDP-N-acetyl-D-galactosamine dehydrogenase